MKNTAKKDDFKLSSATVVDGNLILSLPDALNPVVWRLELGSVKASAMEVREAADKKSFILLLKTPKGEIHDIAPFDSRDKAVAALMKISAALQGAQGKIIPFTQTGPAPAQPFAPAVPSQKNENTGRKWVAALIAVIAVIVLFAWVGSMTSRGIVSASAPPSGGSTGQTGVPESADELLRGF
jgi:hypothetical protein